MNALTPIRRGVFPRSRGIGGFTLVEVLVTTAVTIVAFTGLATLQMLALRSADSAMERSQATALAYELIDRMRLNRGENGWSDTALGGGYDDMTLCDSEARHPDDSRSCSFDDQEDFNDDDNVTQDLGEWWNTIDRAGLTNWYAGIQRTEDRFLVSVQWDDSRAEGATTGESNLRESCLGVDMPINMQEICVMTQL